MTLNFVFQTVLLRVYEMNGEGWYETRESTISMSLTTTGLSMFQGTLLDGVGWRGWLVNNSDEWSESRSSSYVCV